MCLFLLVTAAALFTSCQSTKGGNYTMNTGGKKGILVVSFGTSFPETRKATIEACEKVIDAAFPDHEVRRAFTSHIVIDVIKKKEGVTIYKPEEALQQMYKDGFSEVIVQPLHIIPGEEFHEKIVKNVQAFHGAFEVLRIGDPILSTNEDYAMAVEAMHEQMPDLGPDEAVVFMGHGTHHPANAAYAALQYRLAMEGVPAYVGTVEGYPELEEVLTLLKRDNISKVTLMPFMVVAGDHASNDMAGDEPDSWKSILIEEGFDVSVYLHGLGENKAIQDIYVQHVKKALEVQEKHEHGHDH